MSHKAARDIVVGDVVLDQHGDRGTVTMRDGHTTPGVVYLYLDGNDEPPADMCLNHGDPVTLLDPRPKLEHVMKLAFQLKKEYDFDWDGFRSDPEAHVRRAGFLVDGDEASTTAAAIRLLLDVE